MAINRRNILSFLLPILLGLSVSAQSNVCWQPGLEYVYSVRGRTLAGIHQVQNHYSGVLLNGTLHVIPTGQNTVTAQVEDLQYAKIHQALPGGWSTDIPDEKLKYEKVPNWSNKYFEMFYENGMIVNITFENEVASWEANMIKGIVSQLQVSSTQNSTNFVTKEPSVSGNCETLYDVAPAKSGEAHIPQGHNNENEILEVIKTRNHDKCQKKIAYSFGHPEISQGEAGGNMRTFAAVSTVSNIMISGSLQQHEILSAVTVNKIIMSPTLYNKQKGIVVSMMNLTGITFHSVKSQPQQMKNPQPASDLACSYQDSNSPDFVLQQFSNAEQNSPDNLPNPSIVEAAVKVAREIAEGLQQPNEIPKQGTLSSHSILSNVVRAMTIDDLRNATKKLYVPDSADSTSVLAWKAYRDAVAQSGTLDALKQIADLIMQGKIQGEEAAEVIAVLPKSALNPNDQYMNAFFDLSKSPEVQKQLFLNDTAILSFSELVRISCNSDSNRGHHPFGLLSNNNIMTYIQYLEKQLNSAVEQGDSHKIQVYTRALANIAQKRILQSFQPHLEGNSKMSEYQRAVIVMSMNEIAKAHPEETRSVLYQIYANPHESNEVRVAAVFQLMRTVPPAYILQRMAQYTNLDDSEQVQSAVKTALESAAKLTQPEYRQLALNAQTAFNMLNSKVRGLHYSRDYLEDYIVKEMPLAYKQTIQYGGSADSLYPKSMQYSLRWNRGGYERQYVNFGSMVSSVRSLHDTFNNMIDHNDAPKRQSNNMWVDKIKKMLNIKFDAEQLEGNFYWNLMDTKRFFAYDKNTVAQLSQTIKLLSQLIQNKQAFKYTKLFSPRNIILGFSTEMGLPFVYELRTPSVINVGGHISANSKPSIVDPVTNKIRVPTKVNLSGDLHATVAIKIESKISFLTAFDRNQYIAGYDKNMQMQLPITFDMTLDFKDQLFTGKVGPQKQQKHINMVHYSTWPYTSIYDETSLKPVSVSKSTVQIDTNPQQTVNQYIGDKSTGMVFHLEAQTRGEHELINYAWLVKKYKQQNLISALWAPIFEETIQQRNWNFNYDSEKSTSTAVDFVIQYSDWKYGSPKASLQRVYNKQGVEIQNNEHSSAKWPHIKLSHNDYNAEDNSDSISPRHRSAFVGLAFEGGMQPVIRTNFVYLRDLDEKPSVAMYYRQFSASASKKYEPFFALFATSNNALKTPALNFKDAINNDPSYTEEAILLYGRSTSEPFTDIYVKADMKRTNERTQYLKQSAEAKQCSEQMSENHYALPACANLTVQASYNDNMDIEMHYEGVSPVSRNYTEKIYRALQFIGYQYYQQNSVNASKNEADSRIKLNVRFEPNLEHVNVSINTPKSAASFNQVYVSRTVRPMIVSHPYFNAHERVRSEAFKFIERNPDFVIDYDVANTLNNQTYPLSLTGSWYVAMYAVQNKTYEPKVDFAVLVRRVRQQYKEIMVVLPQDGGDEQVINIFPTISRDPNRGTPSVKVNDEEIAPAQMKPTHSTYRPPYTIYTLPKGVLKLIVPGKFYMLYNNVRAMFAVDNKYRNSIRGLSGPFDGEASNDFTNPDNKILKNAKDFVASYALPEDRETAELQKQAKQAESTPKSSKHRTTLTLKKSQVEDPTNQITNPSIDENDTSCSKQQTQYRIEDDGKVICFTTRSQPACKKHCKGLNNFEKKVDVHCVQRTSVAEVWRKQIDKGASPDFSSKKVTKVINIQVPGNCVAN